MHNSENITSRWPEQSKISKKWTDETENATYTGATLPQLSQKSSRRSARARKATRPREAKKGKILVKPKISLLKQTMQKTDRHIQKFKPGKKQPLEGRERQ
jgi:hypothetical protein